MIITRSNDRSGLHEPCGPGHPEPGNRHDGAGDMYIYIYIYIYIIIYIYIYIRVYIYIYT